jgi:triacylglycerol esterase/lipase EstA (alpha/beta hydrolase family)
VFEPKDASAVIADFVFVHGLGGGSTTTWCLTQDSEYFWPKEWLPKDPDFEGVRVHSFGYNANWAKRSNSPLDVHAFGQSLVEELLSNPKIKGQDTPIVLIGHSMGGLVIKKACILSKTNPDFVHVAERLHSFYFLATPHRGSNLAATLNNILCISGIGRRAYVSGLESQSELMRVLNDQFRVHYQGIHLHTFYESQPTPPLGMIVDVESATLGW